MRDEEIGRRKEYLPVYLLSAWQEYADRKIGNEKKRILERITYITMALGFIPYTQLIYSEHMDWADELSEQEERGSLMT